MIVEQIVVGPLASNCYIIGDEEARCGIVVDPGDDAPLILEAIERLGLEIEAIVATHGHFDHIGAVGSVRERTGAPFLAHSQEQEAIASARIRAQLFAGLDIPETPPPDRLLEEGDLLSAGRYTLRVAHAPGHSPGHIVLLGDNVAFVGDVLFAGSIGRTDLPGGDYRELLRSISRVLLPLPDETMVYPGHGPVTTIGQERLSNPFLIGLPKGL
ncbi:MAG: MBL fold metallo-hydrolase [Armatimonadota bacterium]|nr:MBL fold metallo-hydrolase [Armatimonadota bacterium]MDR5703030.1 MBL fold metallo-hydrolase [Armatimonadota bacterium]MDR7434204.1 MBL fold metallo-hydrolase [Armatimonadota bacterium]